MAADAVILWLSKEDYEKLPAEVLDLVDDGLEIRLCMDLRSYDKFVHCLEENVSDFIVTGDDDIYYWGTWLRELVQAYDPLSGNVPSHRCHVIKLNNAGRPEPYDQWNLNLDTPGSSPLHFHTGVGGALFKSSMFSSEAMNSNLFQKYCPTGDDIWLYWMLRRAGHQYFQVGRRCDVRTWEGSQEVSLKNVNVLTGSGNDRQISAMIDAFGWPEDTNGRQG